MPSTLNFLYVYISIALYIYIYIFLAELSRQNMSGKDLGGGGPPTNFSLQGGGPPSHIQPHSMGGPPPAHISQQGVSKRLII